MSGEDVQPKEKEEEGGGDMSNSPSLLSGDEAGKKEEKPAVVVVEAPVVVSSATKVSTTIHIGGDLEEREVNIMSVLSASSAAISPRIYEIVNWKRAAQTLRFFAALDGLKYPKTKEVETYLKKCFVRGSGGVKKGNTSSGDGDADTTVAVVVDGRKKSRDISAERYLEYANIIGKAFNLKYHLKDVEEIEEKTKEDGGDGPSGDGGNRFVVGSWTISGKHDGDLALGGIAESNLKSGLDILSAPEKNGDDERAPSSTGNKTDESSSSSSDPWLDTLSELGANKRLHYPKLVRYAIRAATCTEGPIYPYLPKTRERFSLDKAAHDFKIRFETVSSKDADVPEKIASYSLKSASTDTVISQILNALHHPLSLHPYFMQKLHEYRDRGGKPMSAEEAEEHRKKFYWTHRYQDRGPMAPKIVTLKDIQPWSTYLTMARTREEDKPAFWKEFQERPGADGKTHHHINQYRPPDEPIKDVSSKLRKVKYDYDPKMNQLVSLWQGDICTLEIDCIVNAANNEMLGGGGIDGAIHKAAGPWLKEDCRLHSYEITEETEWGPHTSVVGCVDGDAKITRGFCLPAKYVIATVGPRIRQDKYGRIKLQPKMLRSCYIRSLDLMKKHNLRSIALNSISTGVFGYPPAEASVVALSAVRDWIAANPGAVDRVIFCTYGDDDTYVYQRVMPAIFSDKGAKIGHVVGGGGGLFGGLFG
eukprot:g1885.t1